MSYAGYNYRATAGLVTDGPGEVAVTDASGDYWGSAVAMEDNGAGDRHTAGAVRQANAEVRWKDYPLPNGPGAYDVTVAIGQGYESFGQYVRLFEAVENGELRFAVTPGYAAEGGYYDANGTRFADRAAYAAGAQPKRVTFTTAVARLQLGAAGEPGFNGQTRLGHLGFTYAGPTPTVTECAVGPGTAPRLRRNETQAFTRTFAGANSPTGAGTWTCTGGTLSDITASGCTFTKNAASPTYSVRWTSNETPAKYAEVSGMRRATVQGVTVSPNPQHVPAGASQLFTATVTGLDNPPQDVTWQASGGGISSGGQFNAGGTLGAYAVQATSVDDTAVSGSAGGNIITPPSGVTPAIRLREGTTPLTEGATLAGAGRRVGTGVVDRYLLLDNNAGREEELLGLAVALSASTSWLALTLDDTVAPAILRVRTTSPSAAQAGQPDVVVTVSSTVVGVASRTFVVPGAVDATPTTDQKVDALAAVLARLEPQIAVMFGYALPESGITAAAATAIQTTPATIQAGAIDAIAEGARTKLERAGSPVQTAAGGFVAPRAALPALPPVDGATLEQMVRFLYAAARHTTRAPGNNTQALMQADGVTPLAVRAQGVTGGVTVETVQAPT